MDRIQIEALIKSALEAKEKAYSPYSHYQVGAALLTEGGQVFEGCNIENASYGATNCAERTAFFKAVSQGERDFRAIAIVGGLQGEEIKDYASPCGICRQVMQEFCKDDFQIIVAICPEKYKVYTLAQILPFGFGGDKIK